MTSKECRQALALARQERDQAGVAVSGKHKGGEWERYRAADDRCIALERELARSLGEPCAVGIDWPARWDVGAPLPHVIASGQRTFIVYLIRERDPKWDGSYATMVSANSPELRLIAVVEFLRCSIFRFGAPSGEVDSGHPLHGRGLDGYRAHTVERSPWIAEMQAMRSMHPQYGPSPRTDEVHYILPFHDDSFECIAKGHSVNERMGTMAEALAWCAQEVLARAK